MIFSSKNVLIRSLKKGLSGGGWCYIKHRVTELLGCQSEGLFLRFASGHLSSITGHLAYRCKKQLKVFAVRRRVLDSRSY